MHTRTTHIILTLLLLACTCAHAQITPGTTWKKDVSRVVKSDALVMSGKVNAFDILKANTLSGALRAYDPYEYPLAKLLIHDQVKEIFEPRYDTVIEVDTVKQQEIIKVREIVLHSDSIYTYKSMERWEFDPVALRAKIGLNGIAPMQAVYGEEDRQYRGLKALLWVPFSDLYSVSLRKQDQAQPLQFLTELVWADFFNADSTIPKNSKPTPLHLQAIRTISLFEEEDTVKHLLFDQTPDTMLSELLIKAVRLGLVTAWRSDDTKMQVKLPVKEVTDMITPKPDTVIYVDDVPAGAENNMQIVIHDFNYGTINTYKVLEDWSFDPASGKIETKVIAIAPLQYLLNDTGAWKETRTMCWLRYDDVKNIIRKYEEYHPINTIAQQIWNSYFLWDIKPEIVK